MQYGGLSRLMFEWGLPGQMLRKVDSMSMAASIEVRVPLLDHRLVEFAFSLPTEFKILNGTRKLVLRRLVTPMLPEKILRAPKSGFCIPLHRSFDRSFFSFCRNLLGGSDSQIRKIFGGSTVDRILNWNETGIDSASHIWSAFTVTHVLWMMAQMEFWAYEKIDLYGAFEPHAGQS